MWGPGAGQTPPCTRRGLGILLALLCQAQLSQGQVYRIQVAPHVTVQQGLCVLLPCNFTADFESQGPVYKYWYLRDADKDRSMPVASTNPNKPPKEPRGRIRVAEKPEDDCSLSISDVRAEDRDRYYFRFEKGESKYSYLEIQPLVNVTELRDQPVLRVPEVLKPGQPVNVTCQAPGTCSGTPPQITWTGGFDSMAMNVSEPQGNGVSYSSVLRFTPTLAHNGTELSCTVTYPAVGVSTRRAVRLHVCCDDNFLLMVSSGVTGGILLLLVLVIVVCKVARARKNTEDGPSRYNNGGNGEQEPSPNGKKSRKLPELTADDCTNMEQVENDENFAGGDVVYENINGLQSRMPSDQIYSNVSP
ncbi:sialic acid-binding Ig-like lectin 12 isoform X2 [Pelodiscus sinensis]|uniref:sialic acid-binding Ig-like lectin 12 isoform X2 n=1 Tax=Pelodiscus sinensis TaxID=13735 RepID=UPI003F6C3A83